MGTRDADIEIGPLRLWFDGRCSREGWMGVTAVCETPAARVAVTGDILQLDDLRQWVQQCERIEASRLNEAILSPAEPMIRVSVIRSDKLGHFRVSLDITPDPESEQHHFVYEIDQSYFPSMLAQTRRVLQSAVIA